MGHNVATFTRPNCFPLYFFPLNRFSEIGLAVFPEAKLFSGWNFPVKNEIQNWNPEFASHYGMPAGDHCGDATDMMPAPAGRRPAQRLAARPRLRPRRPARDPARPIPPRPRPPGLAPRPPREPGPPGRQAPPAPVVNAQRQAPVAPAFEQKKARQAPRRASGQGKGAGN